MEDHPYWGKKGPRPKETEDGPTDEKSLRFTIDKFNKICEKVVPVKRDPIPPPDPFAW